MVLHTWKVKQREIDEITRTYYVEANCAEAARWAVEQGEIEYAAEEDHQIGTSTETLSVEKD